MKRLKFSFILPISKNGYSKSPSLSQGDFSISNLHRSPPSLSSFLLFLLPFFRVKRGSLFLLRSSLFILFVSSLGLSTSRVLVLFSLGFIPFKILSIPSPLFLRDALLGLVSFPKRGVVRVSLL